MMSRLTGFSKTKECSLCVANREEQNERGGESKFKNYCVGCMYHVMYRKPDDNSSFITCLYDPSKETYDNISLGNAEELYDNIQKRIAFMKETWVLYQKAKDEGTLTID
jgi:hypothetical protein